MTASQVNGMPTAFPPPPPPPQPQGAPTHPSLTHHQSSNPYQSTPGQPMYGAPNGQFEPYSTQTSQSNSLAFDYAQLPAVSTPSVSTFHM